MGETTERVLRYVHDHADCTPVAIAKALALSPTAVDYHLRLLEARQRVRRMGQGRPRFAVPGSFRTDGSVNIRHGATLMDLLEARGAASVRDLTVESGLSEKVVRTALRALVAGGFVEVRGGRGKARNEYAVCGRARARSDKGGAAP